MTYVYVLSVLFFSLQNCFILLKFPYKHLKIFLLQTLSTWLILALLHISYVGISRLECGKYLERFVIWHETTVRKALIGDWYNCKKMCILTYVLSHILSTTSSKNCWCKLINHSITREILLSHRPSTSIEKLNENWPIFFKK